MKLETQVILKNQHYAACVLRDGSLVVTRHVKGGGKRLIGAEAAVWIEAIKTALDPQEANALCRGFLQ